MNTDQGTLTYIVSYRRHLGAGLGLLVGLWLACTGILLHAGEPGAGNPLPESYSSRRIIGGRLVGGPAFGPGGHWYLSAEDRYLYSFDANSFHRVFRAPLPGRPSTALSVAPWGSVYLGLEDGSVMGFTRTGRQLFRVRPERRAPFSFAVSSDGELLVVYPGSSRLRAYGTAGTLLWSVELGGEASGAPIVVPNGDVVVPLENGNLRRVGPAGVPRMEYQLSEPVTLVFSPLGFRHPAFGELSDDELLALSGAQLVALGAQGVRSSGIDLGFSDIRTFHQLNENSLLALRKNGDVLMILPESIFNLARNAVWISSHGGAPLIASRNGALMLFSPEHGVFSSAPVEEAGSFFGGAFAVGQALMSAENWGLYMFRVGERTVSVPNGWSSPRGDLGRTGRPGGIRFTSPGIAEWRRIPDFLYLEDLVSRESAQSRRELLQALEPRYRAGRVAADLPYVRHLLERLAGEAYFSPMRRDNMLRNDFPWARAEAVRIIGQRGDYRSHLFLLRLAAVERNAEVRVAILQVLRNIGVDPDLAASRIALSYLRNDQSVRPDEVLARGVLSFLLRMRELEGRHVDPLLREAYRIIAERNYPRDLREAASRSSRHIDNSGSRPYTEREEH